MKAISEMTIEELQDYALNLEGQVKEGKTREEEKDKKITELNESNAILIKRNNDLFMKVEQSTGKDIPTPEEPKKETCEEFAKKLILGE